KRMSPCCGRIVPETTLKSVVLPAPFGPTRPTISPVPTVRVTPSSARNPPKRTAMSRSSSMIGHRGLPRRATPPKAAAERGQQAFGGEQDHCAQQRTQHDLMADRHDRLEYELIDQVDNDRPDERSRDGSIAAEDRRHDRQHGPQARKGVVGLEEVDVVRVESAD